MKDLLTPQQVAFVEEMAAFNAQSKRPPKRLSPAQRLMRRSRAKQLGERAKAMFVGIKVEIE